ncbi:MAG TPA: TonB-dependent receptor [Eudoraea sp.]|nr:TonB-dependent receptor [Eudoraea sp.]
MKLLFSLLLAMNAFFAYSQNYITGTITEVDGNTPLEQVSVYIPQLEKGAVTDALGMYRINNLPSGTFKIVISFIGYQTFSQTISLEKNEIVLDVSLSPSAIEMEEVIVSTPFHKLQRENVMKVEQARISELRTKGAIGLADGITNIAGVESVSTGVGIGKPVIRGLSANRVLVYTQGIRLENQQFGDEHGLGISDAGIESVEVIKGPASLLYGSDAMGGVLYLNPERFAIAHTSDADINLNYFTNTTGISANSGVKISGEQFKFLARGGISSHTDYQTGDELLVSNSRFREYDFKTGFGYQSGNIQTELRYNYNGSDLGIPEEIGVQTRERSPALPYQELNSHIISSTTHVFLKKSNLKLTLGYILNKRKEFEEPEETMQIPDEVNDDDPALDLDLSTFSYNLLYHLPKGKRLETIVGIQGMRQTNENFGEEILIPDATTNDFGILGTSHLHFEKGDMQLGVRYDHRSIVGKEHGLEGQEGFIPALDRSFNSFNAALGYRQDLSKHLIARINFASGFRAPNLAELTSNGVHEGTNRFEVGNPDLENEKNLQTDISLEYKNEHLEFYINGFYNRVKAYIFLEPAGTFIGADAVFNYRQQDARLYGGEIGLHLHPHPLDWLHLESSFEMVTGKLNTGEYLPLMPANNFSNTLRVEFEEAFDAFRESYAFVTLRSVFSQSNVSEFETDSDGYSLLNVGLGGNMRLFGQKVGLRVSANNLLDTTYIAHLSRLKTDGIPNIGRNISLGCSVEL